MKLEASKFGKILTYLNNTLEELGYEEIKFGGWYVKNDHLEFKFFDGKTNNELVISLPKIK